VTLIDTGPLVALADGNDPAHRAVASAAASIPGRLATTWPVFTESMYFLGRTRRWRGQAPLWRLFQAGRLEVAEISGAMTERMAALMERYQNVPMSFADASLVALAEVRDDRRVFTFDTDFRVYRLASGRTLAVVPGPTA
jgi:uncharacterized protein